MKDNIKNEIMSGMEIEYRKRKSLEIQIKPDGRVRVLAPKTATKAWIFEAVKSKEEWILEKLESLSEKVKSQPKLQHGEKVLDAGNMVTLSIGCHAGDYPVERTEDQLRVQIIDEWREDEARISSLLLDWYTENTRRKVLDFTKKMVYDSKPESKCNTN